MKLYTTETCSPCKPVKAKIEALGLNVEIIQDPIRFPEGLRSVPALEIAENKLMVGAPVIMEYLNGRFDG
jgi:glutathione S-transferase